MTMPLHEASDKVFTKRVYALAAVALAMALIALAFETFQAAHGNADQPCVTTVTQQYAGACTGGSWTQWSSVTNTKDAAGNQVFQEQRTYTGTQENVQGSFVTLCNAGVAANAIGSINSTLVACQIVEGRTRTVAAGSGSGTQANGASTTGTITNQTSNASTGAVISQLNSQGSYADFQDAKLANVALKATPSLVKSGSTSNISWTAGHVTSCEVKGTNGDDWTDLPTSQDVPVTKTSAPITAQTTYNLTCTTRIGTKLTDQAVVNVIPVFQEN
jgi:hypothetical protein